MSPSSQPPVLTPADALPTAIKAGVTAVTTLPPTPPVAGTKSTSSRKDKPNVKVSVLLTDKMEKAFRYVSLQLELRGELVFSQQDLLFEMVRGLLNHYATDKSMSHPILRNINGGTN